MEGHDFQGKELGNHGFFVLMRMCINRQEYVIREQNI